MSMTFEKFSDLQMWEVCPYKDDFEEEAKLYPASFMRKFGKHEVHIYFAGSDGCWKWYERPDRSKFSGWSYDMDGMHLFECLRECYDTLSEKGIVE